jgi:hypothetical protein
MTAGLIASLAVSWIAVGGDRVRAGEEKAAAEVLFGSLYGGDLFAADMRPIKEEEDVGVRIIVFQAPFRPAPGAAQESKKYVFGELRGQPPYRWRVREGVFWAVCDYPSFSHATAVTWLPIEDLALREKGYDEFSKKHPRFLEWFADPLKDCANDVRTRRGYPPGPGIGWGAETRVQSLYYDVLPTGKAEALLITIADKRLRLWRGAGRKAKEASLEEWEVKWEELTGVRDEADIREPFTAVRQGDATFLVTRSGKLYALRKNDKDEWKAEAVWKDADSPIRAVLRDEDAGRAFVFTEPAPDAKDGRKVYFELSDKPDPAAYEAKPPKDSKLDEPLATLMGLANFLHDQKKLK